LRYFTIFSLSYYSLAQKRLLLEYQRLNPEAHIVGMTGMAGTIRKKLAPPSLTYCLSSTAAQVGGITLHSWAGIGLGDAPVKTLLSLLNPAAKERIQSCGTLVIHNVHRCSAELFRVVSEVCSSIRNMKKDKYFGGIRLILFGDPLQVLFSVACESLPNPCLTLA
jgi:hypothetical protein